MLVVTDPVVGRSVCHDFGYALAVREPERVKPTKALQPTKARAFTRNAKDRKDERYSLSRPRQTLPRGTILPLRTVRLGVLETAVSSQPASF